VWNLVVGAVTRRRRVAAVAVGLGFRRRDRADQDAVLHLALVLRLSDEEFDLGTVPIPTVVPVGSSQCPDIGGVQGEGFVAVTEFRNRPVLSLLNVVDHTLPGLVPNVIDANETRSSKRSHVHMIISIPLRRTLITSRVAPGSGRTGIAAQARPASSSRKQ